MWKPSPPFAMRGGGRVDVEFEPVHSFQSKRWNRWLGCLFLTSFRSKSTCRTGPIHCWEHPLFYIDREDGRGILSGSTRNEGGRVTGGSRRWVPGFPFRRCRSPGGSLNSFRFGSVDYGIDQIPPRVLLQSIPPSSIDRAGDSDSERMETMATGTSDEGPSGRSKLLCLDPSRDPGNFTGGPRFG